MEDLQKNAVRKTASSGATGRVEYDEFWPSKSKTLLDQIDDQIAPLYGLTAEKVDNIINYDTKFRLGSANRTANAEGDD